ncbi:uncharacterized protein DSM5745_06813 [Aspergillus mulundensis]|uniref:Beta-glucosidase n=1 Tax=Aspergillus mulundensis TaxID=1810919 RepID=A0A3D8RSM7_9EURO|nr:hypothetical protein DSM5745_06813 [Aspergillus mulundensis]RDW76821.1 hypothetical protein DSM5745_06813 [Aspergillus mulundensis]
MFVLASIGIATVLLKYAHASLMDAMFHYTQVILTRYATPLSSSVAYPTPFARPFSEVSSLLPLNATYTAYTLELNGGIGNGEYGSDAYAGLWANLLYTSSPPFTSTRAAVPVASCELIFPPPMYYTVAREHSGKLPSDFVWGVSASAWQIEGALQHDGWGPSVMDVTGAVQSANNRSDANVAAMHYFVYKEGIARLAAIGVPYLSISISWTRIVPFGTADSPINTKGLDHYDDVINTCLEHGITPITTLNHFDFPLGQMDDFSTLPENFLYYAKHVITRFADRVPYWFTFNEPNIATLNLVDDWNDLITIQEAHAAVYHWYKDELGDGHNESHVHATARYQEFVLGIMGNPLFLGQQIPSSVLETDTLGLPPYRHRKLPASTVRWAFGPLTHMLLSSQRLLSKGLTRVPKIHVTPTGHSAECVLRTRTTIRAPATEIRVGYFSSVRHNGMVTEFGFNPFREGERSEDAQRYDLEGTLYYKGFLGEVFKAIHEDGVDVIGALAWSIMVNNEFGSYEEQYGLQTVNRSDGTFRGRFKRSIFDFVDFFHCRVEVEG